MSHFRNDFEPPQRNEGDDDDYVNFPIVDDTDGFLQSVGRPTGWKLGVLIAIAVLVFVALLSAAFGNNKSPKKEKPPATVIADKGGGVGTQNATDINLAIEGALQAWGTYTTTGNTDELTTYFVEGGDQYVKLIADKAKTGQFEEDFRNTYITITSDVSSAAVREATARVSFDAYGDDSKQAHFNLDFFLRKGDDGNWRVDYLRAVPKTG